MLKYRRICLTLVVLNFITSCGSMAFSGKEPSSLNPSLPSDHKYELALVLGGGGAKGIAHLGVIKALEEEGIQPDLIVGTSIGAIVGALYADAQDSDKIFNLVKSIHREQLLPLQTDVRYGMNDGQQIKTFLHDNLTHSTIESLPTAFIAVATNFEFGTASAFDRGDIANAALASAAIPGVISPVKIDDQYYVDGGVSSPVPATIAKYWKPKMIIAVNLDNELSQKPPLTIAGVMERSFNIMYHHLSMCSEKETDVLIDLPIKNTSALSTPDSEALYQLGYQTTKKLMSTIKDIMRKKHISLNKPYHRQLKDI